MNPDFFDLLSKGAAFGGLHVLASQVVLSDIWHGIACWQVGRVDGPPQYWCIH